MYFAMTSTDAVKENCKHSTLTLIHPTNILERKPEVKSWIIEGYYCRSGSNPSHLPDESMLNEREERLPRRSAPRSDGSFRSIGKP